MFFISLSNCSYTICIIIACSLNTELESFIYRILHDDQKLKLQILNLSFAIILSFRFDSTTGTFPVPSGGKGFYYFFLYCLQIRQHNRNIHSALWWRWILLLLCLLFTDMTTQPEHSQCPLVEMDSITSLFIVYRYYSTTLTFTVLIWILLILCLLFTDVTTQMEHSQCLLVEMDSIISLFIVYRYDSTTGTFTVPSGGDGFYYFTVSLTVIGGDLAFFDLQINGLTVCTAITDQHETPGDGGNAACSAVTYVTEGTDPLTFVKY